MPTTASTTTASRSKTRLVVTPLEDSAGMGVARATGGRLRFLTAGGFFRVMARFLGRSAHRSHEACDVQLNWRRARCANEICCAKAAAATRRCQVACGRSLGDAAAPVEASPKLDPGPLHDERRMRSARLLHRG